MSNWMKFAAMSLASLAVVLPSVVSAAPYELQVDVNSTTVQSRLATGAPGFTGVLHTGTFTFQADATCTLDDVLYDGVSQHPTQVPVLVSGTIHLTGGIVDTGSSVTFTFDTPSPTNTLSFALLPGQGGLDVEAGGFDLLANMDTSTFSTANPIGGVGIVPWQVATDGAFFLHQFTPDGAGLATDVNLEVIVPEPASLGLAGLAGLSVLGRRRR